MPETILYSLSRIKNIHGFNRQLFKDFVYSRFKSALQTEKYEEQIYFYYAIKECAIDDRLVDFKDDVMVSKNQILISYFLIDRIILKSDYQCFVDNPKEDEWLQNYHYLLVYDKSNLDLLIPNQAKNNKKQKSYFDFYKFNLDNNIPIVRNINKIAEDINKFVALKISSYSH